MICHAYFIGGSQDLTKMVFQDYPPALYYCTKMCAWELAFGRDPKGAIKCDCTQERYRLSHMDYRYPEHSPYDIAIYIYDGEEK